MAALANREILIIGGTGSLGVALTKYLIENRGDLGWRGLRIYSRDEFKQWSLRNQINGNDSVSFLLGDVRDSYRLGVAMRGVDIVINAAAQKQVPSCEENPMEAVKTNIIGAMNVVNCAIENEVEKVMHVSTDKAVSPINLYGMTKGTAESLILHSSVYSPAGTKFSCCRYGNVMGSRGSVINLFKESKGSINITDKKMTRFWIPLSRVVEFYNWPRLRYDRR